MEPEQEDELTILNLKPRLRHRGRRMTANDRIELRFTLGLPTIEGCGLKIDRGHRPTLYKLEGVESPV